MIEASIAAVTSTVTATAVQTSIFGSITAFAAGLVFQYHSLSDLLSLHWYLNQIMQLVGQHSPQCVDLQSRISFSMYH